MIPKEELNQCSPLVKELFAKWSKYMYDSVKFNRPQSSIHSFGHCERVLLHALILGEKIFGDDKEALTALAHASIFHDTKRLDDYLDTGHGARAAVYYKKFCAEHPEIEFKPVVPYLMRYHDLDDERGTEAIKRDFGEKADREQMMYKIFKDSDALDRWRLGSMGLDPRYLRTEPAKKMIDFARELVEKTEDADFLKEVSEEVERAIKMQKISEIG